MLTLSLPTLRREEGLPLISQNLCQRGKLTTQLGKSRPRRPVITLPLVSSCSFSVIFTLTFKCFVSCTLFILA